MQELISEKDKWTLVNGIRQAATNRLDWRWFLGDLHRITGGSKVHLSSLDTLTNLPIDMMQIGFDPEYMDSLIRYYGAMNIWAQRTSFTPNGMLCSTRQLMPDEELKKTEFYQDWVRPQENVLGGAAMNLTQDNNRRFVIGGVIRDVDREELEPRFLGVLEYLLPHLREAVEINRLLGYQSLNDLILREGMQPGATACFLIASDRKLMYANEAGQNMISDGEIIRCDTLSKIRLIDKRAHQKLASSLFGYSNSDTRFAPPFFAGSHDEAAKYICRAVKLDPRQDLPVPYPLNKNASDFTLLLMSVRSQPALLV